MAGQDHRLLDLGTSDEVHVTRTTDGIYVFYTEIEEAFIRTDQVVDVREYR